MIIVCYASYYAEFDLTSEPFRTGLYYHLKAGFAQFS